MKKCFIYLNDVCQCTYDWFLMHIWKVNKKIWSQKKKELLSAPEVGFISHWVVRCEGDSHLNLFEEANTRYRVLTWWERSWVCQADRRLEGRWRKMEEGSRYAGTAGGRRRGEGSGSSASCHFVEDGGTCRWRGCGCYGDRPPCLKVPCLSYWDSVLSWKQNHVEFKRSSRWMFY